MYTRIGTHNKRTKNNKLENKSQFSFLNIY